METQWPPAPVNARQVKRIGSLRLESDGNALYATQPKDPKQVRKSVLRVAVIVLAEIVYISYPIVTAWWFTWAKDWLALVKLFAPMILELSAVGWVSNWVVNRILYRGRFSLRREPNTFLSSRGRTFLLPATAQFVVTPSRYLLRRTSVLWLTLPGEDGKRGPRFALATFFIASNAEVAKREIERFLNGG